MLPLSMYFSFFPVLTITRVSVCYYFLYFLCPNSTKFVFSLKVFPKYYFKNPDTLELGSGKMGERTDWDLLDHRERKHREKWNNELYYWEFLYWEIVLMKDKSGWEKEAIGSLKDVGWCKAKLVLVSDFEAPREWARGEEATRGGGRLNHLAVQRV